MSLKNKQYRSEEGKNVHLQMTEKLANARNNGLKLCKKSICSTTSMIWIVVKALLHSGPAREKQKHVAGLERLGQECYVWESDLACVRL